MNVSFASSRFASRSPVDVPAPVASRFATPGLDGTAEGARRNRYAKRAFGIGYGSSDGYAKPRNYFATPSLSRYR